MSDDAINQLIEGQHELSLAIADLSSHQYKMGGKLDKLTRDFVRLKDYTYAGFDIMNAGFDTMNNRFDRLEDQVDRLLAEVSSGSYQPS